MLGVEEAPVRVQFPLQRSVCFLQAVVAGSPPPVPRRNISTTCLCSTLTVPQLQLKGKLLFRLRIKEDLAMIIEVMPTAAMIEV